MNPPSAPGSPLPVIVLTGFLGAGKTTLLLRWLEEAETFSLQFPVNRRRAIAEGRLPPEG